MSPGDELSGAVAIDPAELAGPAELATSSADVARVKSGDPSGLPGVAGIRGVAEASEAANDAVTSGAEAVGSVAAASMASLVGDSVGERGLVGVCSGEETLSSGTIGPGAVGALLGGAAAPGPSEGGAAANRPSRSSRGSAVEQQANGSSSSAGESHTLAADGAADGVVGEVVSKISGAGIDSDAGPVGSMSSGIALQRGSSSSLDAGGGVVRTASGASGPSGYTEGGAAPRQTASDRICGIKEEMDRLHKKLLGSLASGGDDDHLGTTDFRISEMPTFGNSFGNNLSETEGRSGAGLLGSSLGGGIGTGIGALSVGSLDRGDGGVGSFAGARQMTYSEARQMLGIGSGGSRPAAEGGGSGGSALGAERSLGGISCSDCSQWSRSLIWFFAQYG